MFAEEFLPIYGVSGEAAAEPQMVREALLSGRMRTAATGVRVRRSWTLGAGSGGDILVHALLAVIGQAAGHARAAAAGQA